MRLIKLLLPWQHVRYDCCSGIPTLSFCFPRHQALLHLLCQVVHVQAVTAEVAHLRQLPCIAYTVVRRRPRGHTAMCGDNIGDAL